MVSALAPAPQWTVAYLSLRMLYNVLVLGCHVPGLLVAQEELLPYALILLHKLLETCSQLRKTVGKGQNLKSHEIRKF